MRRQVNTKPYEGEKASSSSAAARIMGNSDAVVETRANGWAKIRAVSVMLPHDVGWRLTCHSTREIRKMALMRATRRIPWLRVTMTAMVALLSSPWIGVEEMSAAMEPLGRWPSHHSGVPIHEQSTARWTRILQAWEMSRPPLLNPLPRNEGEAANTLIWRRGLMVLTKAGRQAVRLSDNMQNT